MCCHLLPSLHGKEYSPKDNDLKHLIFRNLTGFFPFFPSFSCGLFLKDVHWEMVHFLSFSPKSYFSPSKVSNFISSMKTQSLPVDHAGSKSLFLSFWLSFSLLYFIFIWIKSFRDYPLPNNPKLPLACNTHAVPSFCYRFLVLQLQFFVSGFFFFLPGLLRYNWHTALNKFKMCSVMISLIYIMKQLSQ